MKNNDSDTFIFDKAVLKIFAERATALRKERKLSRAELAKYLGYSPSAIGNYEYALRNLDVRVLCAYSEFFDVPTDYLLGKINTRKPLVAIACMSNITDEDVGNWTEDVQEDIANFIAFRLQQEKNKKKNS